MQTKAAKRQRQLLYIIDKPVLHNPFKRSGEFVVSVLIWGMFLYWAGYLLTAILWLVGVPEIGGQALLSVRAVELTGYMLWQTLVFACLILIMLIAWAKWNYWRFGRLNRRKFRPPVTDIEMAQMFDITVSSVNQLQSGKIISLGKNGEKLEIIKESFNHQYGLQSDVSQQEEI